MQKRTLRKLKKAEDAVSPVVATLMLVLVAAGGAVGLNIWLKSFQDDSTAGISSVDGAEVLRIGGSSTVYEFSLAAIPGFEALMDQQGTPIKVELEKGGSGAGRKAAGLCLVDIGSSSSNVPDSEKAIWPDCDGIPGKDFGKELEIFKVATDGVVFATLSTNTHCASDVPKLTQAQAYSLYYHNMDNFGTRLSTASVPPAATDLDIGDFASVTDGVTTSGSTTVTSAAGFTGVAVNDRIQGSGIPAGATVTTVTDPNTLVISAAATASGTGLTIDYWTPGDGDIVWSEIPSSAGGFCTGAQVVEIGDRQDPGGTSEIASEKLFGKKFGQLEEFLGELNSAHQGDGNQGVLTAMQALANKNDALFFTSFGYATANSLGIAQFGKTSPQTPTSNNIKDESYDATRPILYLTAGKPSPIAQKWLDYVLNPHQNQLIAEAADFEHIY